MVTVILSPIFRVSDPWQVELHSEKNGAKLQFAQVMERKLAEAVGLPGGEAAFSPSWKSTVKPCFDRTHTVYKKYTLWSSGWGWAVEPLWKVSSCLGGFKRFFLFNPKTLGEDEPRNDFDQFFFGSNGFTTSSKRCLAKSLWVWIQCKKLLLFFFSGEPWRLKSWQMMVSLYFWGVLLLKKKHGVLYSV